MWENYVVVVQVSSFFLIFRCRCHDYFLCERLLFDAIYYHATSISSVMCSRRSHVVWTNSLSWQVQTMTQGVNIGIRSSNAIFRAGKFISFFRLNPLEEGTRTTREAFLSVDFSTLSTTFSVYFLHWPIYYGVARILRMPV